MSEKKPALAVSHYYEELREQGMREEEANEGFVWTILVEGTSSIKVLGLAGVDYTLSLNCSHVGPTAFGVYRGELAMSFSGDISGVKAILGLLGISSDEDVSGWFKNDSFIMRIKPYSKTDEEEFAESFLRDVVETPESTGDRNQDAVNTAVTQLANSFLNALLSNSQKDAPAEGDEASGLWYDWDFHMTEGDMSTFLKLNGGTLMWWVKGKAETSEKGDLLDVDSTVRTIFTPAMVERYDEPIYNPFPYTVKIYPDGKVLFTLYNSKGGPVTVKWSGTISRIPVSDTQLIK